MPHTGHWPELVGRFERKRAAIHSDGGCLFDDLVGAGEDRWRHSEGERRGRLEVDDQLEPGRLLDPQIGGLRAAQHFDELARELPVDLAERRPVSD